MITSLNYIEIREGCVCITFWLAERSGCEINPPGNHKRRFHLRYGQAKSHLLFWIYLFSVASICGQQAGTCYFLPLFMLMSNFKSSFVIWSDSTSWCLTSTLLPDYLSWAGPVFYIFSNYNYPDTQGNTKEMVQEIVVFPNSYQILHIIAGNRSIALMCSQFYQFRPGIDRTCEGELAQLMQIWGKWKQCEISCVNIYSEYESGTFFK